MFKKLQQFYEHFYTTLAEGHYRAEPLSLWSFLQPWKPSKDKLPDTSPVEVATRMLNTSTDLGKHFAWGAFFTLLSTQVISWGAVVLGAAGIGLLAIEYRKSKAAAKETITETNFAGQKVQGTRADLFHLRQAQAKLMQISDNWGKETQESTTDTINRIIESVHERRSRVKVLEGGRFGAKEDIYAFSEPSIKLMEDRDGVKVSHAPRLPAPKYPYPPPRPIEIAPAFGSSAAKEEEIVDRMVALQESLPPHIAERVEKRIAAHRAEQRVSILCSP